MKIAQDYVNQGEDVNLNNVVAPKESQFPSPEPQNNLKNEQQPDSDNNPKNEQSPVRIKKFVHFMFLKIHFGIRMSQQKHFK